MRNKMNFDTFNKEVGIAFPVADGNAIDYIFTDNTEQEFAKFIEKNFPCVIDINFNTGATKFFCYMSFLFEVEDNKIIEILSECVEWLNANGKVWNDKKDNNYMKYCKSFNMDCEKCDYKGCLGCESSFYSDHPELEDYTRFFYFS